MTSFTELFAEGLLSRFTTLTPQEQDHVLVRYQQAVASASGEALRESAAAGLLHADPRLRRATVRAVRQRGGEPLLTEVVEWALTDVDDTVRQEALACLPQLPGSPGILRALLDTTGRTPRQLRQGRGPVTTAVDLLTRSRADTLLRTEMADRVVAELPVPVAAETVSAGGWPNGMLPVAGGQLRRGAEADELPGWLPWPGGEPASASVDPLMMDEFPVTVADYDRFVAAVPDQGHAFCHPDEPPGKDHRRSTVDDPRFGEEYPATGVDWYDAFAYAAWCGKRLPTEDEWEWAARGESHPLYPWGSNFDRTRCRWLGDLIDGVADGESWRRALLAADLSALPELACPVGDVRAAASPFGVRGMAGNVWEWTATRFLDRAPLSPRFGTMDPGEVIGNWAAEAVVKGGSYSSCPDQLSPAYRGPMFLFNRSPEVGFRCAATVRR